MSGFFGTNPPDTVVGSPDSDEQTIAENAQDQNDTASGFYQGSPEQTTTDAYTADALASKNAAAVSETNAANSAANAATSEANAATSATSASNVASSIAGDASAATASAASALASKNAAATSETNSATSETNAATSATTAATSATTATTKASEASVSAANAATSESNAATSATNAATSATNAASSESSVSANATAAATSASSAATSATSATASASTATTKAAEASTSESNAATSATNAASSASSASTSATNASNSASSATTAQTAAEAARDSALAAFDSFDDRYLGQKSSNPSTDNDGNALVAGTLYFNTTTGEMKVYDGSAWLNAYASLSGALIATSNLSDLNNAGTARTNLGLGSAATTDASAYATAAQADQTVSLTGAGATSISGTYPSFTITSTDTDTTYSVGDGGLTQNNFTDALKTKLDGVATNANNYTLPFTDNSANWNTAFGWGNHASAGYLMDSELTSEASVKALNQGVATTDSPSFVKLIAKHDTADQLKIGNTTNTEFWTIRAGSNLLFKDNGTVERMRIDSSGRVGIGTSSPATSLHISSGTSGDAKVIIEADTDNSDEGDHPCVRLKQDGGLVSYRFGIGTSDGDTASSNNDLCVTAEGSATNNLFMVTTGGVQHKFWHAGNDGSGSGLDADLYQGYDQSASGNRWGVMAPVQSDGVLEIGRYIDFHPTDGDTSDFHVRLDGSSNRVTLTTPHGYVQLGAQNSSYAHFYTDRGKYYFNKRIIVDEGIIASHNENLILRRANNSSYQMTLSTSGATFTHNVTAYSDGRLKEDVKPIKNALDTVEKLEGVTYTRKDNQEKNIGFIAQQIEEACPELAERVVGEMDDERKTKHVNYANMVALLVEAVKELKAEVDELKAAK